MAIEFEGRAREHAATLAAANRSPYAVAGPIISSLKSRLDEQAAVRHGEGLTDTVFDSARFTTRVPPRPVPQSWTRTIFVLLTTLLLCNVLFFGMRVAGTYLPKERVAEEVRQGLVNGVFSVPDYASNYLIGMDQWTDCLSFELALSPSSSILAASVAPHVLVAPAANQRCAAVVDFVQGRYRVEQLFEYTRFWHGYSTLMTLALQLMPLKAYRGLLTMLCYGAIAFAGLAAAAAGRPALLSLLPLLAGTFAFSQINQLGGLVSHSPAFIAMWILAGLVLLLYRSLSFTRLLAMMLGLGALEGFLDTMILCPLSAALALIVAGCARAGQLRMESWRGLAGFYAAIGGAWCLGFLGTYVFKLAATAAVIGYDPVIGPFVDQLKLRMALTGPQPKFYLSSLYGQLWRLAYGEFYPRAVTLLALTVMVLGWIAALAQFAAACAAGVGTQARNAGGGFVLATLVIFAWFTLFREHTDAHAFFMVRVTIVWIFAGWCWFIAQRTGLSSPS
jgi:hypothetical protein